MIIRDKYEGCIPEIAEALRAGNQVKVIRKSDCEEIWICDYEEIWICDYDYGAYQPYTGVSNNKYYSALSGDSFEIVQEEKEEKKEKKKKLYIKSVYDICEWLTENNYNWAVDCFYGNKLSFYIKMFQFCGKRIKRKTFESGINRYFAYDWTWLSEWVEEK